MPTWLKLLLYFTGVILMGALLAPGLFHFGQTYAGWIASHGLEDTPVLGMIAGEAERAGFPRYFNRAVLIAALALLWPFARWMQLGRSDFPTLLPGRAGSRQIATGLLVAGTPFLLLTGALLATGWFHPHPGAHWQNMLLMPLVAAGAVALLEEWLFRGAFTSLVARSLGPRALTIFIALLFAVLHFMQPPVGLHIPEHAIHAGTGFQLAGVILARLLSPMDFLAGFTTLFAIGLLLGWARQVSGKIWLGVGMHAGWVFVLKSFSAATRRDRPVEETLPWLGMDLRIGLLPLAVLAVTAGLLALLLRRRRGPRNV